MSLGLGWQGRGRRNRLSWERCVEYRGSLEGTYASILAGAFKHAGVTCRQTKRFEALPYFSISHTSQTLCVHLWLLLLLTPPHVILATYISANTSQHPYLPKPAQSIHPTTPPSLLNSSPITRLTHPPYPYISVDVRDAYIRSMLTQLSHTHV